MPNETPDQTLKRVLDHGRVYNLGVAQVERQEHNLDWGLPEDFEAVLDTPRYSDIKGRFFRDDDLSIYQKVVKEIPLKTLFNFTRNLMRPIYTDFTETSENKDFSRIAGKFYFHLFIQESIYVSYKLFDTNSSVIIRANNPKLQPEVDEMKRQKFDLGIKMSDTAYDKDNDFMHLATSIIVTIPNGREHMAHVRGGADYLDNFTNGLNIAVTQLTLEEFVKQAAKLCGTRAQVTTDINSTAQKRKMEGMLESMQNVIYQHFDDKVDVVPLEFMTGQDLLALRDTIYYYLDRLKYEYGRVANTNPKGERYSAGESYKDITAIANRQKETLEYLVEFAYQAKELWNIDLEFAVSGIPEKEAIYTVSHLAQNPNSEKEYFGQVEGTVNRVPLGQPGRRMSNNRSKMSKGKR